jgi:hypothetical protein
MKLEFMYEMFGQFSVCRSWFLELASLISVLIDLVPTIFIEVSGGSI